MSDKASRFLKMASQTKGVSPLLSIKDGKWKLVFQNSNLGNIVDEDLQSLFSRGMDRIVENRELLPFSHTHKLKKKVNE